MIVEKAFLDLYPERRLGEYKFLIKYSGRFNGYNANVIKRGKQITFSLSKKWKPINEDVKIGLIQSLLNKILKTNKESQYMELYEIFLKKVHIAVPKIYNDEILEGSFNRVNERYFFGLIEKTNLCWGRESFRKIGSYEYGSDRITISKILKKAPVDILDFVMYHEMLHKKHKFNTKKGRSYHHTRSFNKQERKFEDFRNVEKELGRFLRDQKKKVGLFGL